MTTKTDPSILPQYRGHPVPWVTRWSGETQRVKWGVTVTRQGPKIGYNSVDGLGEFRDDWGVLWQREGLGRNGSPEWSQVNTYRQRRAMLKHLCQVCGRIIDEKPIRWLMAPDQLEELDEGRFITQSPPTCSGCIDLALELCPNLPMFGYMILKVLDYEPWGVFGEVLVRAILPDSKPAPGGLRRIRTAIGYEEDYGQLFNLDMVLAKQQVVMLGKHVLEEYVEGSERPANFEGPTTTLAEMVAQLEASRG